MTPSTIEEHRLALMTAWGFLGSFGFCFVLSGFADSDPVAGLTGFAAFVAAFIAHVIVNRIYEASFTGAQVVLALLVFSGALLTFFASCLFNPTFGEINIVVGLLGFGSLAACFVVYLVVNYGLRGGYAMVHRQPMRGHPRP